MNRYSNAAKLVKATSKMIQAKGKDITPKWEEVVELSRDMAHDASSFNKAVEAKNINKTNAALYLVLKDLALVLEQLGGEEAAKEIADAGKTFLQK